jgi:hypothetical protein
MKRIEPPRTLRARSLRGLCAFAVQKQFLSNTHAFSAPAKDETGSLSDNDRHGHICQFLLKEQDLRLTALLVTFEVALE